MKKTITYLKNFIKDKDVASVTPSSKFCVRKVCKKISFDGDLTIVEFGAGTGVFAKYLLERLSPDSQLILFETNSDFVEKLEEIDDSRVTIYHESVEFVKEILGKEGITAVDYIISGIPFSFLDDETKRSILQQSWELLQEGGKFLAYQTSGHLKDPLRSVFNNLSTKIEFRNVPPMMVYEAVKNEAA